MRAIAAELGRSPSTVSREIRRNRHHRSGPVPPARGPGPCRCPPAPSEARKIGQNPQLRNFIQDHLDIRWSPEQICQALRAQFPQRPEMHVVHETVYQALYVQGRGELRRELARALRTGRARRKPRRQAQQRQPRFTTPTTMISERPAEAADRAVPGHWEGDLIIGKDGKSAIGTLVERATRYVMLLHLPGDHSAESVRDALATTVTTLPCHLWQSLTWDQGSEMAEPTEIHRRHRHPGLLLRPGQPLAAWLEREHQRPAPPVLPDLYWGQRCS